jgi:hypothetical protein
MLQSMERPENPLSFNSVNQAIEQKALSDKLSKLQQKRQDVVDWATQDAISKGLSPDDVYPVTSDYYATPDSAQRSAANSLKVDARTGAIKVDYSHSLRHEIESSFEDAVGDIEVPEVRPIFTGVRRVINNVRLKRAERKVGGLIDEKGTRAHVGAIILRSRFGSGFYSYADDGILKAPDSKKDDRFIDDVEKKATKRHIRLSRASRLGLLVDDSPRTSTRKINQRKRKQTDQTLLAAADEQVIHDRTFESKHLDKKLMKAVSKRAKLRAKKEALR